jgi:hypothetical protein
VYLGDSDGKLNEKRTWIWTEICSSEISITQIRRWKSTFFIEIPVLDCQKGSLHS